MFVGPNVPSYRRDMTMPVWWTMDHDVSLLKLCLSHGYGSWKLIVLDPLVNTTPDDFVMPPRVNGVEWTTQLTARNAEKRVLALLRGMPTGSKLLLPPPSSPQKSSSSVKKIAAMPSVNKSMSWFQQKDGTSKVNAVPKTTLVSNTDSLEESVTKFENENANGESLVVTVDASKSTDIDKPLLSLTAIKDNTTFDNASPKADDSTLSSTVGIVCEIVSPVLVVSNTPTTWSNEEHASMSQPVSFAATPSAVDEVVVVSNTPITAGPVTPDTVAAVELSIAAPAQPSPMPASSTEKKPKKTANSAKSTASTSAGTKSITSFFKKM
jgi:hypothetical protein